MTKNKVLFVALFLMASPFAIRASAQESISMPAAFLSSSTGYAYALRCKMMPQPELQAWFEDLQIGTLGLRAAGADVDSLFQDVSKLSSQPEYNNCDGKIKSSVGIRRQMGDLLRQTTLDVVSDDLKFLNQ